VVLCWQAKALYWMLQSERELNVEQALAEKEACE
jgi:hypothetical protein